MKKLLLVITLILPIISFDTLAIFPDEIIGKSLDIPRPAWAGHVGVTTSPYLDENGKFGNKTTSGLVFETFPKGNHDDSKSSDSNENIEESNKPDQISLKTLTPEQIARMDSEKLIDIIAKPGHIMSGDDFNKLFELAQQPQIDAVKKTVILDVLGFYSNVDMIQKLIDLYRKTNKKNDVLLNDNILDNIRTLYERYTVFYYYPKEKAILSKFYLDIMGNDLSKNQKGNVLKGILTFNSSKDILLNINKIRNLINEKKNKLHSKTALTLQMGLFDKSPEIEQLILSDMINNLKNAKSYMLDGIFIFHVIYRLASVSPNDLTQQSKDKISIYLDSLNSRYDLHQKSVDQDGINELSYGMWLEASALANSNTLEEAAHYIANYIGKLHSIKDKEAFMIGLSRSTYIEKAFATEPELLNLKSNHSA